MLPLFVYGTLCDPDLLPAVLGRAVHPGTIHPAAAPGFAAVTHPGRPYPALVRRPGGRAPGLLLLDLSPFERDLLDAFEGPEYRRGTVAVMVEEELHEADAYLPVQSIPSTAPLWSLATWTTLHKARAVPAEAAAAAELRAKLLAIRPN